MLVITKLCISLGLMAALIGGTCWGGAQVRESSVDNNASGVEKEQTLDFAYYSIRDGYQSKLTLVSGVSYPLDFSIAVHSLEGETRTFRSETIRGGEERSFDILSLLNDTSESFSQDFAEGSITVSYKARESMLLLGQITVSNLKEKVSFESEMLMMSMGMSMEPQTLNALWWGLSETKDAVFAISNTADKPAEAGVFLDVEGQRHASPRLYFGPHETKLLSMSELLAGFGLQAEEVPQGGISITAADMTALFAASGHSVSRAPGLTTTFHFLNPSAQMANILYATGVPIGKPTSDSPFGGMGSFTPHIALRNLTTTPQVVNVKLEYPAKTGSAEHVLGAISVPGRSTREIVAEAPPIPVPYSSIRIEYSGTPGSVIAEVSSRDSRRGLVIDSRLVNEGDEMAYSGSNPWRLDGETDSVLFLNNMGNQAERISLRLQTGMSTYFVTTIRLAPHETRAIDIRGLRDAQKPDFRGVILPFNASSGSLHWSRLGQVPVSGRLLVINKKRGISSNFDCGTPPCHCPANWTGLAVTSPVTDFLPGQTWSCTATQSTRDCYGNVSSFNESDAAAWSSSNTAVAYMDSSVRYEVHGAGGGAAQITATDHGPTYTWTGNKCIAQTSQHTGSAPVKGQVPTSLSVIAAPAVALTNFKNCVAADYGIALAIDYQVLDQDGSKILSSAMEPVEKVLNVVFNTIPLGDSEPNWVDIGPSNYPGTSQFTNTSGQFTDAPWGACSNGPFTETLTQPIGILLNQHVYTVRTSNWTTTGTGPGHGSATNGTDINVTQ